MAEQVDIRHPDSPLTLTVSRPALRVYRARGWVPASEYVEKRTRRPRPAPAAVREAVAEDVDRLATIEPAPVETFTDPLPPMASGEFVIEDPPNPD